MTTLHDNNDIETGSAKQQESAKQFPIAAYTHFKDIKHDDSIIRSILVRPQPRPEDNTKLQNIIIRYCQCCVIIFCFPIIFTDLYFGFNSDPVCINQTFSQIKITMADYLKVCGFYNLFMLGVTLLAFNLITQIDETEVEFGILNMVGTISKSMLTAWNIVGAVMYWAYFDKNLCNDNTNNYINISLVIKLIYVFLAWCIGQQNNKKTEN